jgi:hypothetical protein
MPWSAATLGFDSPRSSATFRSRSVTHRGGYSANPAGRWLLRAARDPGFDHRTIGWLVHDDGWVLRHVIRTAVRFHSHHVMTRSRSVVTSLGRGHVPGRIKNRRVVAGSRFTDTSTSMTCPNWSIAATNCPQHHAELRAFPAVSGVRLCMCGHISVMALRGRFRWNAGNGDRRRVAEAVRHIEASQVGAVELGDK